MTTQAMGILLGILGLLAAGFGTGLFFGMWMARKWGRRGNARM